MEIARTARNQIPQVVQNPLCLVMPIRAVTTTGTRPFGVVAAAPNDFGFGQILRIGDALGGIGQVFSRSRHGRALLGVLSHLPNNSRICTK